MKVRAGKDNVPSGVTVVEGKSRRSGEEKGLALGISPIAACVEIDGKS